MMKYNFKNDYSEGAHPRILKALSDSNYLQQEGYGEDVFSLEAAKLIRHDLKNQNADIHFVTGGTQANLLVISSILRPYESVIAAETAHIEVHEAGAIEFTGHKINLIKSENGKINSAKISEILDKHTDEHQVKPKLVFISNSTEIGSIYKKNDLEDISQFCKQKGLYLYIDGARLGSAITSKNSDLSLSDISKYADIFYIGGTKNGALIGEAIVINNENLKQDFRFNMKQKGSLIAKGRIIGIQFNELFKNGLYYELASHANNMALKLAKGIKSAGYNFLSDPETNQIFPIFPNLLITKLSQNFGFYVWAKQDEKNSIVRLVCSWATNEEMIEEFLKEI